ILALTKWREPNVLRALAQGLAAVVSRESHARRRLRIEGEAGAARLGSPAVRKPAMEPVPEPLPDETLVELLKHPLCVSDARRAILDALGTRYKRRFADQWDFVRFAQEQKLGLDFTTPPALPETTPTASAR